MINDSWGNIFLVKRDTCSLNTFVDLVWINHRVTETKIFFIYEISHFQFKLLDSMH